MWFKNLITVFNYNFKGIFLLWITFMKKNYTSFIFVKYILNFAKRRKKNIFPILLNILISPNFYTNCSCLILLYAWL